MICDIYDNVLEEHVAQLIDMEMKEISWKYDYRSHKDGVNKHWHTLCGHEELFEEYSFLSPSNGRSNAVTLLELPSIPLSTSPICTFSISLIVPSFIVILVPAVKQLCIPVLW